MGEAAVSRDSAWLAPFQFKKGQSGNPGGKSIISERFKSEIRKRSNNGNELLDYLFENLRNPKCNEVIRFKSSELLIQYGIGKPAEGDSSLNQYDLAKLSPEELSVLRAIHERCRVGGSSSSGGGEPSVLDATLVQPPPSPPASS